MGLPSLFISHLSPARLAAGSFPVHSSQEKSKPRCTVPGLSPQLPVPLWPHDHRCTCDLPATPCWPSNPLSSPWCLLPQYVRFRPLLCLGTLTLPPSSLVQELPQLEWLDPVLELVASSDLSSSDTPVTHP